MKKIKYLVALVLATIMMPIASIAAPSPIIDSANLFQVKNQTTSGSWGTSVTASPGQTIGVLVHLHNGVIDSTATNVTAKVTLPSDYVTSYTSTATVDTAENSPVSATTKINLTESSKLVYVPGSTVLYNHNNQIEANLPDGITTTGITALTSQKGCWEYERWIRFEVKVVAKPVVPPTPTPTPIPTPTVVTQTTATTVPTSGPAEAAAGALGLTGTGGAAYAWLRSKKNLLGALKKIK